MRKVESSNWLFKTIEAVYSFFFVVVVCLFVCFFHTRLTAAYKLSIHNQKKFEREKYRNKNQTRIRARKRQTKSKSKEERIGKELKQFKSHHYNHHQLHYWSFVVVVGWVVAVVVSFEQLVSLLLLLPTQCAR